MAAAAIPWIMGIGTAASVGTSIYGAKKAADASKQASAAQVASGDKALALQREMWQDTRQSLQPWITQGSQAVTTLGDLMGLGGGGGAAPPAASSPPLAGGRTPTAWDLMSPEEREYVSRPATRRQTKEYLLTGNEALDPSQTGLFTPQAPTMAAAMRGSSYVTLQAPDGTTQQVPETAASHYLSRGARLLS